MNKKPLVTFAVLAYNQEKYVREAIRGALSQTYQPLQVILSDDCSTDGTYDIMKQEAENYCGPATIAINRMINNAGLTEHLNEVVRLSKGKLIVPAAGDDISESNRVERLVARWAKNDYKSGSIFSTYLAIRDDGGRLSVGGHENFRTIDACVSLRNCDPNAFVCCPGCTQAFTRDVFEVFGNLLSGLVQEDFAIKLRSCLIGGVVYCPEPLVRYRQTPQSATRSNAKDYKVLMKKRHEHLSSFITLLEQFKLDCKVAHTKHFIDENAFAWSCEQAEALQARYRNEREFLQAGYVRRLKMAVFGKNSSLDRLHLLAYALFPYCYGWRSRHMKPFTGRANAPTK